MENQNEKILEKILNEEKKSKRRMYYYTSIPLVITVVLIMVSYITVNNANKEVKILRIEKAELNASNEKLSKEIQLKSDSLANLMELAVNYKNKRYEFNYAIDKQLYSRYPKQTEMLSEMRGMIQANKVKWYLGGNSPELGFDSPSFASFVINRHSKTRIDANERYKLRELLPSTQIPQVGDVVFYEHGYAMLYFEYRNEPFVVGMTPLGLASLQFDFGPKLLGFGKVTY
ncbi:hypothetical protein [uncultured Draconibacterium sp.]|uniref:hypothetical protein n=1 Tax=uncultured Draconibacterium sp. TaxID=1573823 RepID=UPI0032171692